MVVNPPFIVASSIFAALLLLWAGAALSGVGQGGAVTWIGLLLSAVAGLMLRQSSRWERGLVAGDGIAPRNRP